nr:cation diffusion facilitator family transporter [Bacteriovoracaceae bacterium]
MFKNPKNREYEIKKVLLITLFLNVLVALIKIIAGRLFNFLSLTSSGFDSLFDGSSNVLALITISMAYRPADFRHHYGYRKYENLGSLIISLLLLYTAVQIGQDAWHALHHENHPIFSWKLVFICLLSILVNFFVSTYEKRKGEELKSSILMADSHHTRGDYIVSFGVLISLIFIYFEIYWMDIVMSLG